MKLRNKFKMGFIGMLALGLLGCGGEKKDEKITIGVTLPTLQHQFFIEMYDGIEKAAKKENVELLINDANLDSSKQIAAIEDFSIKQTDGIIISGIDNTAVVPTVEEVYSEGTPVVTIDALLNTDDITSFIGTANKEAGKQLGEYTKKYIDEQLGGKAKIGIITFLESQIQQERIEGFKEAFKDSDNIVFLNPQPGYNREGALSTTENILQANPDLDIIYATAENSVLGAKAALESANVKATKIVGFDLTEESAEGIEKGIILGMVQQQPQEMGRIALETTLEAIKGNKVEKNIPVPVILFDKENIKEYVK